jgi:arylsulfatase A-like enzyme
MKRLLEVGPLHLFGVIVALGLVGWLLLRPAGLESPESDQAAVAGAKAAGPNVLLILWDTVRADRMSLYGYSRPTTPYIDAFSQNALVFERAVSPGIWTVPAHGSLFTGLPVSSHGAHSLWTWLDGHHVTLAEWLGEHGYDTYLFSANVYVEDKTNLTQGFDTRHYSYKEPWRGPARKVAAKKLIPTDQSTEISPAFQRGASRALGWSKSVFKDSAPVAQRALMRWLSEREGDAPFFAYLNLMEAHSPRTPSLESRESLLSPEQLQLGLETDVSQVTLVDYTFGDTTFTTEQLDAINGVYDASVLDLDKATGALLDALDEQGILDDTIVILTADHGENLGEHGHFEHRLVIYEPLTHVPLLIYYPKAVAAGRVGEEVSTLDLFATVLDILEIKAPPTLMAGDSLLELEPGVAYTEIAGAEPGWTNKIMQRYPAVDWAKMKRSYRSVNKLGWKFIQASDGERELYSLDEDPHELDNIVMSSPDRAQELERQLQGHLQGIPKYDRARRSPDDAPVRAKAGSETERQLRQLGYVE